MKVQDSSIAMSAQYERIRQESVSETLRVRVGRPAMGAPATANRGDRVTISDAARAAALTPQQPAAGQSKAVCGTAEDDSHLDPQMRRLKRFIELLTGVKIHTIDLSAIAQKRAGAGDGQGSGSSSPATPTEPEWSVEYDAEYHYSDAQHMSFEAAGTITAADGETIKFALNLTMQQQESRHSRVSVRMGNAKKVDPIVINLTSEAARLSEELFEFDLDADGRTETIPLLQHGSGYLVLDANQNGAADDGAELFGPASGNGFADLAAYDSDGNGWLDEGDAAWTKLFVWSGGENALIPMPEANIGAIYLRSVDTQFEMKNNTDRSVAELARMGMYVRNDKTVGTVQQIDFLS